MDPSFIKKANIKTKAVHAGETKDKRYTGSIADITMSNTFSVDTDISFSAENLDEDAQFIYTRWGNPTIQMLEQKVAALENGEAALAFSSGMAAITGLMMQKLKSGDRALVSDVSYAGVREFGNDMLKDLNIEVVPLNFSNLEDVEKAFEKPAKFVFSETPCNPILRLTDIHALAEIVHRHGAELAVDSTFATPMATKPLELGADYVIHSMTKYLGGHGDAIGGIVAGSKREINALRSNISIHMGSIISPFNAWLINRGIVTLPMRMQVHSDNAMKVAKFLEGHPKITKVFYPGLPSHPQHELAQKQMQLYSGMITFQMDDPKTAARRMKEKLKIFHYAVSLGHHKSLIFYISTDEMQKSTFKLQGAQLDDYLKYAGEGVFRVSIGLEDPGDLINDLDSSL